MGNIVSDQNNNNYLKDGKLNETITDWAINNYDAGLNYGKTDNKIKKLLQKRACCTSSPYVNIALPIIDVNDIQPGYYPVKIQAFNGSPLTNKLCIISDNYNINPPRLNQLDENINKQNYLQPIITKENNNTANDNCTAIYTTNGEGLCSSIKNERQINYPNNLQANAYGYYASQPTVTDSMDKSDTLLKYNNYTDCNCLNSVLRDTLKMETNNIETIVQSNDIYCTTCSTAGKCYIGSDESVDTLCINYLDIESSLNAQDNSNIILNQNCGDSSSPAAASNKTVTYIIYISIFVAASLAGLIASGVIII